VTKRTDEAVIDTFLYEFFLSSFLLVIIVDAPFSHIRLLVPLATKIVL